MAFFLQLCHAHHGCPVSPDGGLMNINISQCEKGLYLLRSYQPRRLLHVLLWSDLCWSTTSREGKSSLEFPPFVHNLSDCGFVEYKLFRDSFVTFSSLMSNINFFPRSSIISFFIDMIHFHKHDQTLIDPCSLNKTVTYWHLIVIALTQNTSAQMDSNFTFKWTANPRDSHTYTLTDMQYWIIFLNKYMKNRFFS